MNNNLNPLSAKEIEKKLKSVSGWILNEDKVEKQYQFSTFLDALNFINKLSKFFEKTSHHPDIHIYYNKINFSLYTHDAGDKITPTDFIVANEIEIEYKNLKSP